MSAATARLRESTLPPPLALRDAVLAACNDPHAASPNLDALWRALVEGRYRFVESFDWSGWRYFVLHENMDAGYDRRLTRRELALVEAVGRGQSEKGVAFGIGVTPSTASALLKSALLKLGLRSKVDLVRLVGALLRSAGSATSQR
jgi:DNA-binding NarL/FixJ family response regulator